MKKAFGCIAILLLSLSGTAHAAGRSAAQSAPEKDWSQINVDERLAWTKAYTTHTCPQMPPPTTDELKRKNDIGGALVFQWMVKRYIDGKCPAKTANAK